MKLVCCIIITFIFLAFGCVFEAKKDRERIVKNPYSVGQIVKLKIGISAVVLERLTDSVIVRYKDNNGVLKSNIIFLSEIEG